MPEVQSQQNLSEECERCGIIFSKYQPRENRRTVRKGRTTPYVIVGSVILVFLVIFLPNFMAYNKKFRPPVMSEAKQNLGGIFTSQVSYFGEEDTYASSLKHLGWLPACMEKNLWSGRWSWCTECECIYTYTIVEADATHFIARAEGNIDDDPTVDVWEVDDRRKRRTVVNDRLE